MKAILLENFKASKTVLFLFSVIFHFWCSPLQLFLLNTLVLNFGYSVSKFSPRNFSVILDLAFSFCLSTSFSALHLLLDSCYLLCIWLFLLRFRNLMLKERIKGDKEKGNSRGPTRVKKKTCFTTVRESFVPVLINTNRGTGMNIGQVATQEKKIYFEDIHRHAVKARRRK